MPYNPPLDPPPLRSKKTSATRLVAICVALAVCGALVVPGYYLFEWYRGKRAWDNYEAEAKQRGVKFDFAEFLPSKIPDAENFASIPIFQAAFEASEKGQVIPNPFKLPPRKGGGLPQLSDPNKQAPIDLSAWQKYFVETNLLSTASHDAATDVLKALDHFAAPLAELHEAAARPHCHFPVHWEKGFGALLPHLTLLHDASMLYALRMSAHLALGESSVAYSDFHDGLRLRNALAGEPAAVDGLFRIRLTTMMENALWGGLARNQWGEQELRKIDAELSALNELSDYVFVMNSERCDVNLSIDEIIRYSRELRGVLPDDSKQVRSGIRVFKNSTMRGLLLYPTGWHYLSKVRWNRYVDELVARIDLSERRYHKERATPSSPPNVPDTMAGFEFLLFSFVAVGQDKIGQRFIHAATDTDLARIACALERFRISRSGFPKALSELVPEFLPAVPVEIVNGEAYRYRLADDGSFVLYSVATDLRDNGGMIDPRLSASNQRDWVWRYPAK